MSTLCYVCLYLLLWLLWQMMVTIIYYTTEREKLKGLCTKPMFNKKLNYFFLWFLVLFFFSFLVWCLCILFYKFFMYNGFQNNNDGAEMIIMKVSFLQQFLQKSVKSFSHLNIGMIHFPGYLIHFNKGWTKDWLPLMTIKDFKMINIRCSA